MTHESLLHLSNHTNITNSLLVIMSAFVIRDRGVCLTEIKLHGRITNTFTKHENKFSLSRPVSSGVDLQLPCTPLIAVTSFERNMGHTMETEHYHTSQSFSYINMRFGVCSTRSGGGNSNTLESFGRGQ